MVFGQAFDFYDLFYAQLKKLQGYHITHKQFFHSLMRGSDFTDSILLRIGGDYYGFSEWVQLRRTSGRRLRFETGDEGTTLPGIIFWVGLDRKGKLRITKTEKRGRLVALTPYEKHKIAKKTLTAVLKIVPPTP